MRGRLNAPLPFLCQRLFFQILWLCLAVRTYAAPPLSYSRNILPLLRKECVGCHGGANPASGYSMETREHLLKGGRHGAAIVPGNGAQSSLVRYLTGELQPKMPPGGAIDRETIARLRRWIDAGAKVDALTSPTLKSVPASHLASAASLPAPITALAFSPDGKWLAAGGYRVIRLLDAASGRTERVISGLIDQVQALAWSGDGRTLAAAGGIPGQAGEVALFQTQNWQMLLKLTGHTEVVYAVAWKPGGGEIATGSLDKTARIWNPLTGQCTHVIKDHAEAVFGIAYSPNGKLLATGSGDRSAKLFDTGSWKRVVVLTAHTDAVTRVAFNASGSLLATSGADRQVRIWTVKPGTIDNPERTLDEGDGINDCVFSPDGSLLVWGASNHKVKVFNGEGKQQQCEMDQPQDWVYSVAVGRDNRTLAAGTQDGRLYFWDVKSGRLLRMLTFTPLKSHQGQP